MTVLVTAASRHGSTTEIGERIAEVLRSRGLLVVELPPDDVLSLCGLDAVVLGSALYTGDWLQEARHFVDRFAFGLGCRDVWAFSSGPVGAPLFPVQDGERYGELVQRANAREHKLFPGQLSPEGLRMIERLAVRTVRVAPGDYRDWVAVEAWSQGIADALAPAAHGARVPDLRRT